MGQDIKLDFEKYCVVDGSPKTVLVSPRDTNVEKKKVRKKVKSRNEVFLSQNKEFTEISFNRYRSASCRAVPSIRLEVDEAPRRGSVYQRRGSVYQSSNEVGRMSRIKEESSEERKKIAVSRRSAAPFSLELVDSLCSSDEDTSSLGSFTSSSLGVSTSSSSVNKENRSRRIPMNKSLSAKLAAPHSPTKTESESSNTSSKTRFSPFRKMFDPFTKSKSLKSPLGSAIEEHDEVTTPLPEQVNSRNTTLRKSLLNDFSNTEGDAQTCKKDSCSSVASCTSSPAHLSGSLKMRNKNGVPYFEFSVKNPHDVWVAKTWNTGDSFNWVYTFHMAQNKRRSNVSARGSKDHRSKEFLMMAQMQVSCYLCTELINAGAFDNSMLTEFVLYDLARPRHSVTQTPSESNEVTEQPKVNSQSNMPTSNPWPVEDLHPDLESAAIVLQFPPGKRETVKYKREDKRKDGSLNVSRVKLEESKTDSDCLTPAKVSVVIPSGNHGMPSDEAQRVSPLLERWRLGGGCDCGGWDMGCPLVVFDSPDMKKDEACNPNRPVEIFLKGTKEKTPALTMKLTEEGQYAVDFHAKLSSLQAFSICVAMLHGTEASIAIGGDMNRQMLQCDSLRVFLEDEVKQLIEAVAEGEKRISSKNLDEIPPTFVVNPPFSPMSRA
ncbi:hypothetical protein CTI12_AA152690 [Artemisia annua]|uniref:Uncharacterized protein n=1 Tax=Artemisia annua TaxID=35608 RepID=A0A2U1PHE0_ARTAN|nr:hypothetical protein CTI12_AA152690 [Artemisia annua]